MTIIELGNLLNLPDILDIQGTQSDTSLSDDQIQETKQITPTKRSRPDSPPAHHPWSSHSPLKDTILTPIRQDIPSPSSMGCCVPRSKDPIVPWGGIRSEEAVYEFLDKHFDKSGNYYNLKKCDDCERITSALFLETETTFPDPIKDMEHYLHRIIDSDDVDTRDSKHDHNEALMNHKQLKIIHEGIKHEMDKEKLEKLKEEYNPSSEIILESTWNLEDNFDEETTDHSDKIVTNLYEDLANLNLEEK